MRQDRSYRSMTSTLSLQLLTTDCRTFWNIFSTTSLDLYFRVRMLKA